MLDWFAGRRYICVRIELVSDMTIWERELRSMMGNAIGKLNIPRHNARCQLLALLGSAGI